MPAAIRASSTVIKLKPVTHAKVQVIAHEEERPMGEVVTFLVDRYERERFWNQVRADYARLKADPVAWQEYLDPPPYYAPEEEQEILAEVAARRSRGE
jgi:hypothetical protein